MNQEGIQPNLELATEPSGFERWLKGYAFANRNFKWPELDRFRPSQHTVNSENFTRRMLIDTGLFRGVYQAPEIIDVEESIDMFVELPSGRVIAIDLTYTQDDRRQRSKSFKFTSALGTEQFPNIPWIVLPFDEQKYREIADGKKPLPNQRVTQLEMINGIITKLELKRKLRPLYDQALLSEYLEELHSLRNKLI